MPRCAYCHAWIILLCGSKRLQVACHCDGAHNYHLLVQETVCQSVPKALSDFLAPDGGTPESLEKPSAICWCSFKLVSRDRMMQLSLSIVIIIIMIVIKTKTMATIYCLLLLLLLLLTGVIE